MNNKPFTITDLAGNKLGWCLANNGYEARVQFTAGTVYTPSMVKAAR